MGSSFKKTQKILTKIQRLATSGRYNSAMITDRRKFTNKSILYGLLIYVCLVSTFTVRINSKSFPWDVCIQCRINHVADVANATGLRPQGGLRKSRKIFSARQ